MEQNKIKGKDSKGITLIALVITIIVLLILAGITIGSLTSDNGVIKNAKDAKNQTEVSGLKEQIELAIIQAEKKFTNPTLDDVIESLIENDIIENSSKVNEETGAITTKKPSYVIEGMLDDYISLISAEGTKPYLPSSDFTLNSNTSLKTGLVIKDKDGNEYVWIEVPNDGTGPDYSDVEDSTDYENIEIALQKYASDYRETNFPGYVDEWYDGEGSAKNQTVSGTYVKDPSTNLDNTTGCGLTYSQYVALKNKMLASIYDNGGFWIGRYEAGISEPRLYRTEVSTDTTIKVLSQQNQYPLNLIFCNEAQILASKVNSGKRSSSLMFGIQWDLVLKYLEVKAVENGTPLATIQSELKTDSTSWGNHYLSEWTISNTKSKYHTKSSDGGLSWTNGAYGTKKANNDVLLATGATDSFSKMNIFDLFGNVCEWTLERATSATKNCSVARGCYNHNYSSYLGDDWVGYRGYYSTQQYGLGFGFRVAIY